MTISTYLVAAHLVVHLVLAPLSALKSQLRLPEGVSGRGRGGRGPRAASSTAAASHRHLLPQNFVEVIVDFGLQLREGVIGAQILKWILIRITFNVDQ